MTLTLRAVSLNDHPLTQPITAHFDAKGGSVGRSDHNTLALPDPERHISRQHAEISVGDSGYLIKNVGSANPIIVRGQALSRGESAPLVHHDQLRIGGYLLEVIHEEAINQEASTIVRGRAAVDARTSPGVARQAAGSRSAGVQPRAAPSGGPAGVPDMGAPLSSSNPFADLLGDPAAAPAPAPAPAPARAVAACAAVPAQPLLDPFADLQPAAAGVSPLSAAWAPAELAPGRALLPDDFDPFASPVPKASAAEATATAPAGAGGGGGGGGRGVFDDLIPGAAPASIDQLFGLQTGERDPLSDFMADLTPPRAVGSSAGSAAGANSGAGADANSGAGAAAVSTDPMAMFGAVPKVRLPHDAMSTPADNVPELRAAFLPPPPVSRPVPPSVPPWPVPHPEADAPSEPARAVSPLPGPPPTSPANDDAWSGDPRQLWAAFCEGAGVALDPPHGVNPELMRIVGGLLHAAVAGTLQLMMVRATAKHELRAQVTMIQARNNNPLKFSPDARSALEQMLAPPMRGFLAGPAAMTDAMHDLVGHTIGTMAGTRAALEGVLDRFTPQQLEAKLVSRSMLDSLLPMNRKAKLWELYLNHFDTIRNEAHDDFHTLFGRAFLAAYEQQLDRLQREEPGKT